MRRLLKLSVCAALILSFMAAGCSEESCKDLLDRLNGLQDDIITVANKRRALDAAGTPGTAQDAADLAEEEMRLRARFEETAAKYIANNCESRTGEPVPPLPPQQPVTQTPF